VNPVYEEAFMKNSPKNTKLAAVVLVSAFLTLGLSMPSCPGQQAMQQQIDSLQIDNTSLKKRVGALEAQLKTDSDDMSTAKQLLSQMTTAIKEQQAALGQLDTAVKELAVKVATKPAPARPAPATPKRKPRR
jgi:septal ring factor EnvC (AmiA/AmiB activator)